MTDKKCPQVVVGNDVNDHEQIGDGIDILLRLEKGHVARHVYNYVIHNKYHDDYADIYSYNKLSADELKGIVAEAVVKLQVLNNAEFVSLDDVVDYILDFDKRFFIIRFETAANHEFIL